MFNPIGRSWNNRIITFSFQNSTLDLSVNAQRQAIRDAFNLWSDVTDLAFLEVCNGNNADIVFLWGTINHGDPNPICYPEFGLGPFDGENGVLAHSMGGPGPNDCGIQAGDIHFDDDEDWTKKLQNPQNIPDIGYFLGVILYLISS